MILGIHGLSRSGKDTVADILCSQLPTAKKLAFADTLKDAASILLRRPLEDMYEGDRSDIMPEWGFSIRDFLQRLGTEAVRNTFGKDFWIKRIALEIENNKRYQNRDIVIPDVRFENEARFIRNYKGLVVHVLREESKTNRMSHSSENGIRVDNSDAIIYNEGSLTDLEIKVTELVKLFFSR